MKFIIDSKVFKQFPTLIVTIPIIMGFDNTKSKAEAISFLRDAEAKLRQEMTMKSFWKDPRVTAYLDCFRGFGVDPKEYVPAHVALAARVLGGKNLPDINPMVNLYNAISIKYLTPFGGENLDSLYGDFVLKFAAGGEQWIPIGRKDSQPAVTGELVWRDDLDLSTRALNWRQCDRTKMTRETKNGYFVMDGFSDVNEENIKTAANEFLAVATRLFGGKGDIYWLDKDHPEAEIPFSSKKISSSETKHQFKSQVRKAIPNQVRKADLPQLFQMINWEGENTLSFTPRQIILRAIHQLAESREANGNKFSLKLEDVKIEHPKIENYGDYSSNIALVYAGRVGMKPRELAEKIAEELNKYIRTHQSISSLTDSLSHQDNLKSLQITKIEPKAVSDLLESASTAGPGFINLTIQRDYLSTLMLGVLDKRNGSMTTSLDKSRDKQIIPETGLPLKEKKIMVEFAHPNTHKEFHIGHLRNISIGESIIRTLEAAGAKLFRANYEGDVGLHVAKAIWGVKKKLASSHLASGRLKRGESHDSPEVEELRKLSPANKAKFLGEAYALGNKMYEEDEAAKREIIELNKSIYKDPKKVDLWEETRRWSLEYFETVYKRLGSRFDRYYFESEVEAPGKQMVVEGIKKGIFIRDKDGSIYFPGKKYGLNNCVFVTRENYATYEGKDIAVESLEYEEFPFNVDIHVVAHEQKNFFQIAFKALELLSPIQKDRQFHLAYGMVNLKGGKLSSRTGQVITADWLIDQAKEKIIQIIRQSARTKDTSDGFGRAIKTPRMVARRDSSEVEGSEEIAEKVAVAAVKYSMLRVNPRIDIAFDIEESVSFEGDSGPYLMYTYARCRSVIRKWEMGSGKLDKEVGSGKKSLTSHFKNLASHISHLTSNLNPEELSLLRTLYRFPEVVVDAARTLSPNLICSFLFDLAQKYNLFYNKHSILSPSLKDTADRVHMHSSEVVETVKSFRLALTCATAKIISRGLYLLGIETVERM